MFENHAICNATLEQGAKRWLVGIPTRGSLQKFSRAAITFYKAKSSVLIGRLARTTNTYPWSKNRRAALWRYVLPTSGMLLRMKLKVSASFYAHALRDSDLN